jgi:hypothetical protein
MIPASYLFKDVYRRTWLRPADARRAATRPRVIRHAFAVLLLQQK